MLIAALDELNTTVGFVALGAGLIALIALAVAGSALARMRRLRAAQLRVLGEHGDRDLVEHAASTQARVDDLQAGIDSLSRALFERLDDAERRLAGAVSRTAVVRYDAFNETSGRQSSTVALIDDHGDGVILSAILQREQARVYAKPVQAGRSTLELSPEEQEALERARSGEPA